MERHDKKRPNEELTRDVAAPNALLRPLQEAANERGHGPQTRASGVGGLIGGMVGSFGGPLGAFVGAAIGAGVGYLIADQAAEQ